MRWTQPFICIEFKHSNFIGLKKKKMWGSFIFSRCKQNFTLQNITSLFLLLCNFRKPRDHVFSPRFLLKTGSTIWWSVYILMQTDFPHGNKQCHRTVEGGRRIVDIGGLELPISLTLRRTSSLILAPDILDYYRTRFCFQSFPRHSPRCVSESCENFCQHQSV